MVVKSNISISKASQYVHTTEQDNISFDAQGGAYHNLTITLNYKQTRPVYGYDTYADYIRVYAPANAQLQGGNGFDSGHCMNSATVFFFQAEDGIRDLTVTGVQTCALPI